ncbi:MAG: alpha/beta hydrolase [Terrimicrobiaceae bacterium]
MNFEAHGAAPLPVASEQGYADHDGARIWYATFGSGSPVILLHGGLGHSGNWGYQVPVLVSSGHRAVVIDSRGYGCSTRDSRPFTYELMASDVLAVMDALHVEKAACSPWSIVSFLWSLRYARLPGKLGEVTLQLLGQGESGRDAFILRLPIAGGRRYVRRRKSGFSRNALLVEGSCNGFNAANLAPLP